MGCEVGNWSASGSVTERKEQAAPLTSSEFDLWTRQDLGLVGELLLDDEEYLK